MSTAASLPANLAARSGRNRARAITGTKRGSAPVRRRSAGPETPDGVTRPLSYPERSRLMTIVEEYCEANRGRFGVAPLTPSALRVLRVLLFKLMDRTTGRIDAALVWIAKHARRAYQTVVSAIHQLEAARILFIQRRCRPSDSPDGPPWVQDTNLYGVRLPAKLAAWWEARAKAKAARQAARAPEDAAQRAEEAASANAAQERELFADRSDEVRREQLARDLAREVHGPGAAAWRARRLEADAAHGDVLPPPESRS